MDTVVLSLQDLIFYFRPPEEELEHEDKQFKLRSLKNRQNLFQEEVCLSAKKIHVSLFNFKGKKQKQCFNSTAYICIFTENI